MSADAVRAVAGLALAALALAGCGGDEELSGPATLAPEAAPVYAEAVVKPGGEDREALDSSLGRLLGDDDPAAGIDGVLDGLTDDAEVSWSEDIAPWAGERAGTFALDFADHADGALIVEIADAEAAERELERIVTEANTAGDGDETEDLAQAIVDDHALLGSEVGVHAAVDAAAEGALSDSDEFAAATESLSADRLVTFYASPEPTLDALREAGEIDARERGRIAASLGAALDAPVALGLGAGGETLRAELGAAAESAVAPTASELIERIPESAWLALALGDAGPAVEAGFAVAASLGAGLERVERAIGLDLTGLAAATGDAGGFLGGTSILGLGGAAMLEAEDPDGLAEVLDGLERGLSGDPAVRIEPLEVEGEGFTLLPGDVPIQFPFALRDDLLVAGLGTDAAEQAFDPDTALADSYGYEEAIGALGEDDDPVAYLDFERMLELLDGLPGFWDDPDLAEARPYLERLDSFVAGVREDGERALLHLALTVRPAEDEDGDEV